MVIHTVKQGETLSDIANIYGVSEALLARNNDVFDPLVTGDDLVILFPEVTHTVSYGETLFSIAEKYGTTARELYQNNYYLKGNPNVYPGQTIVISYEDNPTKEILTNGYAYPFVRDDILKTSLPYIDYVSPFTYGMTYDGELVLLNDQKIINLANQYNTGKAFHLSTLTQDDRFDSELAEFILQNEDVQNRLISNIGRVMAEKGFTLIDVDFEYISGELADDYGRFIEKVKTLGYPVIVAAAPKTSADQKGLLYEGHDYRILGNAADYLFVMTYEWGYTYGPPQAVAPLPNVTAVLEYAVTEVSPQKILMGIANYGYDFTLPFVKGESRATSIGNRQAVEIARLYGVPISYDETAQSPYFNYVDGTGRTHEVWFENARSIYAKFQLLNRLNLAGYGVWNLMRPFPQLWLLTNALYK